MFLGHQSPNRRALGSNHKRLYRSSKHFISGTFYEGEEKKIADLSLQLDTLSLRASYVSCTNLARSLISQVNTTTIEVQIRCIRPVIAHTHCQMSGACLDSNSSNPCCFEDADWVQCCTPTEQAITTTVLTPDLNLIRASCPAAEVRFYQMQENADSVCLLQSPECLATFLNDYLAAQTSGCGSSLPNVRIDV